MSTFRVVFSSVTTSDLRFADATIATDGGLTVVLREGQRVFAIPTSSVTAIERLPDVAPPADEPKG